MKKTKILLISIVIMGLVTCFSCSSKSTSNASAGDIQSIEDLTNKTIGVQAGTTGASWVKNNVEGAKIKEYPNGVDAASDLKNGNLDAIILDELPASQIIAQNSSLIIVRDSYFTENKEEYAIAVRKESTELLASINSSIAKNKTNGRGEALLEGYMPSDGNIQVLPIELRKQEKTLRLGTNPGFPPFEYKEGNNIVGFDITLSQFIARDLEMDLEIIDIPFGDLITALNNNEIDLIAAGMSVTSERKKLVNFSTPYYQSEQVIVVRK